MTGEPTTTAAAGAAGWKLIGGMAGVFGIGAAASAVVVMLMTPPRSAREWAVGLICTVIGSIAGGAYLVIKIGLLQTVLLAASTADLQTIYMVLCAVLGISFACGLPSWAIVRWTFTYIDKRHGKGIDEIASEAKNIIIKG